ncbi:MAG: peptidylprolyl isomerase [Dehalococcoidia bacterium]
MIVLERARAVLQSLESAHLNGKLLIKPNKESDEELMSWEFEGDVKGNGDSRVHFTLDIDREGFSGNISFETRDVSGISYSYNPFTGEWETDEDFAPESNNGFDPFGLDFPILEDLSLEKDSLGSVEVYRISGSVPDDPKSDHAIMWIGIHDLRVYQVQLEGTSQASDFEGLLPENFGEVFRELVYHLNEFNEPVEIVAPSVSTISLGPEPPKPEPPRPDRVGTKQYSDPPMMVLDPTDSYTATINTNQGDIHLELFAAQAPVTVNNFVFLAQEGFYNGLLFHRVIPRFMVQGGDPTGTGTGGPGYVFGDEIVGDLMFDRPGVLAMASAGPNTNGSQFFITVVPTPHLNGTHTIFGQVRSGQEVVDAISSLATDLGDRPQEDVVIEAIEIQRDGEPSPKVVVPKVSDSVAYAKDITAGFTRVANIPVSAEPWRVTLTPDAREAYVLHGEEALTIIDIGSQQVEQTVQLGFTPTMVVFSQDSKLAFLAGPEIGEKGSIAKFDTMSKSVVDLITIETSFNPFYAAFSSEGRRLYVGNPNDRFLMVIDPVDFQITKRIPLDEGGSFGLAIVPDGSKLYVTHAFGGSLSVIDTQSDTVVEVIEDIAVFPVAILISADGRRAFIADNGASSVVVLDIDTPTPTVLETINTQVPIDYDVGTSQFFLGTAVLSFSKDATQLWVWNGRMPYVAVIDLAELVTEFFIRVEENTSDVAIESADQLLVMSNEGDNTVSILQGALP